MNTRNPDTTYRLATGADMWERASLGGHQKKVPQVTGDSEGRQVTYCIFRDQTYRVITWHVPNPHWPRNSKVTTTAFACLEGLPDILGKAIGATD